MIHVVIRYSYKYGWIHRVIPAEKMDGFIRHMDRIGAKYRVKV